MKLSLSLESDVLCPSIRLLCSLPSFVKCPRHLTLGRTHELGKLKMGDEIRLNQPLKDALKILRGEPVFLYEPIPLHSGLDILHNFPHADLPIRHGHSCLYYEQEECYRTRRMSSRHLRPMGLSPENLLPALAQNCYNTGERKKLPQQPASIYEWGMS
jgi:hypothetical protein